VRYWLHSDPEVYWHYPRYAAESGCIIAPLYGQPALTDEERKAIWTVAEAYAENDGDPECERIARIMQGLWQRTS
jgi:hypothetical protein